MFVLNYKRLSLSLLLTVCTSVFAQNAHAGSRDSVGGDTDASEFIANANRIASWSVAHPNKIDAESAQRIKARVDEITKKMDGGVTAPVQFTEEALSDSSGVRKMAIVDRASGVIQVERPRWRQLSGYARYQLVALEILGLAGVERRYLTAEMIESNFAEIAPSFQPNNYEISLMTSPVVNLLFDPYGRFDVGFGSYGSRLLGKNKINFRGHQLAQMENSLSEELFETADNFRQLPLQYQFDVLVAGVTRSAGTPKKNTLLDIREIQTRATTELFGRRLNAYASQLNWLFSLIMDNSSLGKIDDETKEKVAAIQQQLKQIIPLVDASYRGVDGNGQPVNYLITRSPYSTYTDAVVQKLRAQSVTARCLVPSTYRIEFMQKYVKENLGKGKNLSSANLEALRLQAQNQAGQFANGLRAIGNAWSKVSSAVDLAESKIQNESMRLSSDVPNLLRILERLTEKMNENFKDESEVLLHLLDGMESGELCVQS